MGLVDSLDINDTDKLVHYVSTLMEISGDYTVRIFSYAIQRYVNNMYYISNTATEEGVKRVLYYKSALSFVIELTNDYITLDNVVLYIDEVRSINIMDIGFKIQRFDAILYILLQIVNDSLLQNPDNNILEKLTLLSIQMSNHTITNILVKYLDDDSIYKSEHYRDSIPKYDTNNYTSLFSEDIYKNINNIIIFIF